MKDYFDEAFPALMDLEGWGIQVDDTGGVTKWGISQKTYPDLNISALSMEDAKAIYFYDYWQATGYYRIADRAMAIKVFCTGVVMGPYHATRCLQKGCNVLGAKLDVDGKLGPKTSAWVNGYRHPRAVEAAFKRFAFEYVMNLKNRKYIAGWLMRIDKPM